MPSTTDTPQDVETTQEQEARRLRETTAALRHFGEAGAMGLLVVDADFLYDIEKAHGKQARRTACKTLRELVERFLKSYFLPGDLLIEGEPGVDELRAYFFRPRSSHKFLVDTLPGLPRQLSEYLSEHRSRFDRATDSAGTRCIAVGSSLCIHTPELAKERQVRLALDEAREDSDLMRRTQERELRREFTRLLLERRIRTVFQPIVSLGSRTLHGYEALARASEEDSRWASAPRLFRMAERTGLLYELDSICRASALRSVAHRLGDDRKLFINSRATALYDPRFRPDALRQTLRAAALRSENLVIEISEREFASSPRIVRETREHMRNLGVKVALTDTGTMCSSFGVIMDLDPDYIKVDIQLVRTVDTDVGRQEMLRSLQTIADRLDASIIAVGIETGEEVAALQRIGIRYGQGFLLGMPDDLQEEKAKARVAGHDEEADAEPDAEHAPDEDEQPVGSTDEG